MQYKSATKLPPHHHLTIERNIYFRIFISALASEVISGRFLRAEARAELAVLIRLSKQPPRARRWLAHYFEASLI